MPTSAFAPGHVSGVFAVHDDAPDLLHKGSRGVGWSVDQGATATVTPRPSTNATHAPATSNARSTIRIGGAPSDARVTRRALEILTPGKHWDVDLRLDLPVGQGFGMSAAGTLATCLAVAYEAGLDPEQALEAAHQAEVASATGLGDAVGSWFGAGEIRIKPGCPPAGWAMRVEPPQDTRFLFCVLGQAIPTPNVIRDATWKAKTRELGDPLVDRVLAAGRPMAWSMLLDASAEFSQRLGLMPDAMRILGASLPPGIRWGQSMLGNTLWATGRPDALAQARPRMAQAGQLIECGVDLHGARRVRPHA
jgi:pantoate kinase